jgi:hypothetical protein
MRETAAGKNESRSASDIRFVHEGTRCSSWR